MKSVHYSKWVALIAFIGIFLTSNIEIQAQRRGIEFGPKASFIIPIMSGENYFSKQLGYKIKTPVADLHGGFGVLLEVPFNKWLSVQTEVTYSMTAYSWYTAGQYQNYLNPVWPNPKADPDITEHLTYWNIPLLFRGQAKKFGFFTGGQFSSLLTAKESHIDHNRTADVKSQYQSNDFAWIVGLDFTLNFGLGFNARYQHGLKNIAKATPSGIYDQNSKIYNRLIEVGMFFKIGHRKNVKRSQNQ